MSDAAAKFPAVNEKLRQAFKNSRDGIVRPDKDIMTAPVYKFRAAVALYLLAEVKDYESLPMMAGYLPAKGEPFDNPNDLANPKWVLYSMHRLAGQMPTEKLSVEAKDSLGGTPMQQIWFDHLLALSMLQSPDGWDEGRFVVLAPQFNPKPAGAAGRYQRELLDDSTFGSVTLEDVVAALERASDAVWVTNIKQRYLDQGPIDTLLASDS